MAHLKPNGPKKSGVDYNLLKKSKKEEEEEKKDDPDGMIADVLDIMM